MGGNGSPVVTEQPVWMGMIVIFCVLVAFALLRLTKRCVKYIKAKRAGDKNVPEGVLIGKFSGVSASYLGLLKSSKALSMEKFETRPPNPLPPTTSHSEKNKKATNEPELKPESKGNQSTHIAADTLTIEVDDSDKDSDSIMGSTRHTLAVSYNTRSMPDSVGGLVGGTLTLDITSSPDQTEGHVWLHSGTGLTKAVSVNCLDTNDCSNRLDLSRKSVSFDSHLGNRGIRRSTKGQPKYADDNVLSDKHIYGRNSDEYDQSVSQNLQSARDVKNKRRLFALSKDSSNCMVPPDEIGLETLSAVGTKEIKDTVVPSRSVERRTCDSGSSSFIKPAITYEDEKEAAVPHYDNHRNSVESKIEDCGSKRSVVEDENTRQLGESQCASVTERSSRNMHEYSKRKQKTTKKVRKRYKQRGSRIPKSSSKIEASKKEPAHIHELSEKRPLVTRKLKCQFWYRCYEQPNIKVGAFGRNSSHKQKDKIKSLIENSDVSQICDQQQNSNGKQTTEFNQEKDSEQNDECIDGKNICDNSHNSEHPYRECWQNSSQDGVMSEQIHRQIIGDTNEFESEVLADTVISCELVPEESNDLIRTFYKLNNGASTHVKDIRNEINFNGKVNLTETESMCGSTKESPPETPDSHKSNVFELVVDQPSPTVLARLNEFVFQSSLESIDSKSSLCVKSSDYDSAFSSAPKTIPTSPALKTQSTAKRKKCPFEAIESSEHLDSAPVTSRSFPDIIMESSSQTTRTARKSRSSNDQEIRSLLMMVSRKLEYMEKYKPSSKLISTEQNTQKTSTKRKPSVPKISSSGRTDTASRKTCPVLTDTKASKNHNIRDSIFTRIRNDTREEMFV